MFYDILDKKRTDILPLLKEFKSDFYLAGGTGLALQLGHRDSLNFDFFSEKDFDSSKLFESVKNTFKNFKITKIQDEKNTLTILIDENIKISFFAYHYPLLKKLIDEKYLKIASVEDIACMKFSAIVGRATKKDYVDLYFILQKINLKQLLNLTVQKYPSLDSNLILKSLVYFKDILIEPIKYKNQKSVSFETIKKFLIKIVKDI